MAPRRHLGWMVFAAVMLWGESVGDIPRLLLPHRSTPPHIAIALMNATAVLGLTLYAFRWGGPGFWRLFAPLFALFEAALLGSTILPFSRVLFGLLALGKDAPLLLAGALLVVLPMAAMLVFTTVALLRLGDWTGPTRRPVGLRPAQLSLPI